MLRAMGWGGFLVAMSMVACGNETGTTGAPGADGAVGAQGPEGPAGPEGQACWDLDGDGIGSTDEDTNGDGLVDVQDCHGSGGGGTRVVLELTVNHKGESCGSGTPPGLPGAVECCPPGFSLAGYGQQNWQTEFCVEDLPGTGRTAIYLNRNADHEICVADPVNCCPDGFELMGVRESMVVCLEEL